MARRREDPKEAALRAARTLNPRPEAVADEAFTSGPGFFDARDLVQVKYEMVRRSEIDGVPAAAAAAAFGFSRQSLYTAKSVLAGQGLAGLIPARPGPRGGHKLTEEVVDLLEELLAADATLRPAGLAAALRQRTGISVHPRSAERALSRRRAARASHAAQPGQDDPKSG